MHGVTLKETSPTSSDKITSLRAAILSESGEVTGKQWNLFYLQTFLHLFQAYARPLSTTLIMLCNMAPQSYMRKAVVQETLVSIGQPAMQVQMLQICFD